MRPAVLLALLASCTTSLSIAEFDQQANTALCERAFECEHAIEPDNFAGLFGSSVDDCITRETNEDYVKAEERSAARGTTVYDPDAAALCVDELRDLPCGNFLQHLSEQPDCIAAFRGTMLAGGHCDTFNDCVDGLACGPDNTCVRF